MMESSVKKDPMQRSIRRWMQTFQILSNLILAFLGKGGLALSIISKLNLIDELTLLDHYQNINLNTFLACSVILIVIGWVGIFAGSRNCYNSTLANGFLLGAFLVCTVAYTAATGVIQNNRILYLHMKNDMNNYEKNIVDKLQTKLSCCGLDDINTWNTSGIPTSCCRNHETKCNLGSPYLQTNGCFEEFIRMSQYYAWLLFSVLTFAGLIEIFGIMLSFVQCRIIRDTQKSKYLVDEMDKNAKPQIAHSQSKSETQDNEENKNEEKEEKEKKQEEKKEIETGEKKEEEKESREKEEENKEIETEEKKEEEKESREKAAATSEKAENSDKEKNVEEAKQITCRNIRRDVTSAHRQTSISINIYG